MGTLPLSAKSHSPPAKVLLKMSCNKEVARVSPVLPGDGDKAQCVNVDSQRLGATAKQDQK